MHKGFTLIEFVVIISIFAIMAAVALFNFQGFNSNIALSNVSHDIALTLRQAQVFGWSAQTDTNATTLIPVLDANGNPEQYADGVYFPYDTSTNSFEQKFLLYTKTDPVAQNAMYTSADVVNDTIKIQGNVRIVAIQAGISESSLAINAQHEVPSGATAITQSVSLAFSRPRPDAIFFIGNALDQNMSDKYMAIYIASTTNTDPLYADHVILVSRFGEIEVQ